MKKRIFICVMLLFVLVAGGWALQKVKVITPNGKPLIDLNEILTPNISTSSVEQSQENTTKDKDKTEDEVINPETEITMDRLTLTVRNTTITCMGRTYTYNRDKDSIADFDRVIELAGKSAEVIIDDDFGEAHAIYCVKRLIYEGTEKEASVRTKTIVEKEAAKK